MPLPWATAGGEERCWSAGLALTGVEHVSHSCESLTVRTAGTTECSQVTGAALGAGTQPCTKQPEPDLTQRSLYQERQPAVPPQRTPEQRGVRGTFPRAVRNPLITSTPPKLTTRSPLGRETSPVPSTADEHTLCKSYVYYIPYPYNRGSYRKNHSVYWKASACKWAQ